MICQQTPRKNAALLHALTRQLPPAVQILTEQPPSSPRLQKSDAAKEEAALTKQLREYYKDQADKRAAANSRYETAMQQDELQRKAAQGQAEREHQHKYSNYAGDP